MPRGKVEGKPIRPKNAKNIYVQKINSLAKISRESLAEAEMEIYGRPPKE